MRTGQDVDSIGVNGTAILSEDGTISGVWVASVKSGSPASNMGIRGGDIITRLEGLVLAMDGTMADYCDVLRTHLPEDVLSVEVLRFDSGEMLEGKLNDYRLKPIKPTPDPGTGSGGERQYFWVEDDSGLLTIEVPEEWSDVDGLPFEENGEIIGPAITASTDLEGIGTPGVLFIASRVWARTLGESGLLAEFDLKDVCASVDRDFTYEDSLHTGTLDIYGDCEDGLEYYVLAASPDDLSFIMLVLIGVESGDQDTLDHIFDSFQLLGELP